MAEQDEAQKLADPAETENGREPEGKDFWDKLRASGTIVVAIVVAFMGGWFNHQQAERNRVSAESQFYTDLLAQRERSDSELRSEMFKTLFEAYFRGKLSDSVGPQQSPREEGMVEGMVVASGPAADSAPAPAPDFAGLERRIMFLDVLVRNFESIDIRPLFEDLDRRLTEIVWSDGAPGEAAAEARQKAFGLRWQLRRAALGNVVRQVSALSSLDDAKVERLPITEGTCSTFEGGAEDNPSQSAQDIDEPRLFDFGTILINRLEDGSVYLSILLDESEEQAGGSTQPVKLDFQVTFFDMPVLENIRLPSGKRLTVTLASYFSPREYKDFVGQFPAYLAQDYRSFLDSPDLRDCRKAQLTLLQFPDSYIGPRDRPYIQNLIKTNIHPEPD
jgi:hypothetical protein